MLKWALVFAFFSVSAAVFGFTGIAAGFAEAAQILFMVALTGFLLFMFLGLYMIETVE